MERVNPGINFTPVAPPGIARRQINGFGTRRPTSQRYVSRGG
jgi:hypothetical protein